VPCHAIDGQHAPALTDHHAKLALETGKQGCIRNASRHPRMNEINQKKVKKQQPLAKKTTYKYIHINHQSTHGVE
jgi:hypothetical protein